MEVNKMSLLKNVIRKPAGNAPKGIIYGAPGIGKTTFGASAKSSIILDCENGAGAVRCCRTPYLETWADIMGILKELATTEHEYKVVVIDSLDWVIRRIEEDVSGVSAATITGTLNRSHGGYGNGKQVMKNHITKLLLPVLDRLIQKNIAVVLTAHAKRTDVTDEDGVTTTKNAPDIMDDYLNIIVEWSDFVLFARRNEDGQRVLATAETQRTLAKNRYNMPPEIKMEWTALCGAISAGLKVVFAEEKGVKENG
jgi:hypothetical protein